MTTEMSALAIISAEDLAGVNGGASPAAAQPDGSLLSRLDNCNQIASSGVPDHGYGRYSGQGDSFQTQMNSLSGANGGRQFRQERIGTSPGGSTCWARSPAPAAQ